MHCVLFANDYLVLHKIRAHAQPYSSSIWCNVLRGHPGLYRLSRLTLAVYQGFFYTCLIHL